MHWLDLLILVFLGTITLVGLIKGLVRGLFSILALAIGLVASNIFGNRAGALLDLVIGNPGVSRIIAFISVFLIAALVVVLIGRGLRKLIKFFSLRWLDILAGGVIGLALGVAIIGVLLIFANRLQFIGTGQFLAESRLACPLMDLVRWCYSQVPPEVSEEVSERVIRHRGEIISSWEAMTQPQ